MELSKKSVGKEVRNRVTGQITQVKSYSDKPSIQLGNGLVFGVDSPICKEWEEVDKTIIYKLMDLMNDLHKFHPHLRDEFIRNFEERVKKDQEDMSLKLMGKLYDENPPCVPKGESKIGNRLNLDLRHIGQEVLITGNNGQAGKTGKIFEFTGGVTPGALITILNANQAISTRHWVSDEDMEIIEKPLGDKTYGTGRGLAIRFIDVKQFIKEFLARAKEITNNKYDFYWLAVELAGKRLL